MYLVSVPIRYIKDFINSVTVALRMFCCSRWSNERNLFCGVAAMAAMALFFLPIRLYSPDSINDHSKP